jgi:hypothetical protein
VDWTDIDLANQTLNGIIDPWTGEPVAITADTLICTKQLEMTALRIRNASEITVSSGTITHTGGYPTSGNPEETHSLTATRLANPVGGAFTVMTSRLLAARLGTDTTWFYGSPRKYAKYMENWPITVTQAPAGNSDDFNRDVVSKFKCSERGQYVVVQPRVMTTCTA